MLRGKSAKHRPMATPDGVVAGYFVIEYGNAQAEFPSEPNPSQLFQKAIRDGEMFYGSYL
jgi:hypothetical protein